MLNRNEGNFSISRCVGVIAIALVGVFEPRSTVAEDWMFRRSYFSHVLPEGVPNPYPVPESRGAYRTAYYHEQPGLQIRSAYRINNFVIQNGQRTDRTIYQEGYIEFGP